MVSSPVGLLGPAGPLVAVVLIVLALILIFAGRRLMKLLAFLAAGLVGFWLGSLLAGSFAGPFALVAGAIGFIVLGLLGVFLMELAIVIVFGYLGYYLVGALLGSGGLIPVVAGLVFFVVALVLRNKILSVVAAFLGGALLFEGLVILGVSTFPAGAVALVVAIVGAWYQTRAKRRQGR